MGFDTSWDVDLHKSIYESSDDWQLRRAFLIANKNKYPKERLLTLSHIFMNVELMECKYPKPTMDLIENLSKDFIDNLRNTLNLNVPIKCVTDSNAVEAKDPENAHKKMRYLTPFDSSCIIPGFMLIDVRNMNIKLILEKACGFCNIAPPEIDYLHLSDQHVQAKLFLQNQLIAVSHSNSEEMARRNVRRIAYNILKEMCFTLKVKDLNEKKTTLSSIVNDSTINASYKDCNKISDNNKGYKILKKMGWKEGDGLGKNNQGITSPIEIIYFKKRFGLSFENCETNRINLEDFKIETKKFLLKFFYSPKKRLIFSTEFTTDERKIIHTICDRIGLKSQSFGKKPNRFLIVVKSQFLHEIFDELSNCTNFENDYYKLKLPQHEQNNKA